MSERKEPRCSLCGKVITVVLSDVGSANGYLCLPCSGATLEDFIESDEDDRLVYDACEAAIKKATGKI